MAKVRPKEKSYVEADLILLFGLQRLVGNEAHPLMQQCLNTSTTMNEGEQYLFDVIWAEAEQKIDGWQEEELKMKFISFVLKLGHLEDNENYNTYFERSIEATVEGHFLKTNTDFMVAKGVLNKPQNPYFHFQEWKKHRDPNGDPVGQLIEAFLIAQTINQNKKPLYGCTISGKYWEFFIMENKTYCISASFDATKKAHLLQIVAILRNFNTILQQHLLIS